MSSLVNNDTTETEELNEEADKVKKPKEAANIIKQYEEILRTKRKSIISVGIIQGKCLVGFAKRKNL